MKQFDYERFAYLYDIIETDSKAEHALIHFINQELKAIDAKSVCDISCGTGKQAIPLAERGYSVKAMDASENMLKIAKEKALERPYDLDLEFVKSQMNKFNSGPYDSVISIFNSIGHLSRKEFEETVANVANQLKKGGKFIFDIHNYECLAEDGHILDREVINTAMTFLDIKVVRYVKIDLTKPTGILNINERLILQKGDYSCPEENAYAWQLQTYTIDELKVICEKNGFSFSAFAEPGLPFDFDKANKQASIYVVAEKQ